MAQGCPQFFENFSFLLFRGSTLDPRNSRKLEFSKNSIIFGRSVETSIC